MTIEKGFFPTAEVQSPKILPFEVEHVLLGPDEKNGYVAKYNGTIFHENLIAYRNKKIPPIKDQPDYTENIGIDILKNNEAIPYSEILHRKNLPERIINLEDPRAFTFKEDNIPKVIFGLTAVDKNKKPYPAIVVGKYPFTKKFFSEVQILSDLPSGKNVCPFSKNVILYREEKESHMLTMVINKNGVWEKEGEVIFPDNLEWASYKIGLTGNHWINKIWERGTTKGRILIHGIRKNLTVQSQERYEYSLGIAEFQWKEDYNNLCLIGISKNPILTYQQMQKIYKEKIGEDHYKELNSNKLVLYSCDGGRQARGKTLLPLTYKDTLIVEISIPTKKLLKYPLLPIS